MTETWEVLESWRNENRYNPTNPEVWWILRRRVVPGGWLYQARTLFKESGGATYFYRITSEQMALTFVPTPSALTAS